MLITGDCARCGRKKHSVTERANSNIVMKVRNAYLKKLTVQMAITHINNQRYITATMQ